MYQMHYLLNRNEAASILGIKPQTLSKWSCSKLVALPYVKVGRRAMYSMVDIENFIERNRVGGAA